MPFSLTIFGHCRLRPRDRLPGLSVALYVLLSVASSADADVSISTKPTQNMTCTAGTCTPAAANAVLNASDLEALLASGNLKVTTTGSGVQANNIHVEAVLAWSNASTLSFDAYQSIRMEKHVAVPSSGGLSITTNDGSSGGTFSFGPKGRVSFASLSSPLSINGSSYTLVNSIAALASAVAANSFGNFALADNYDARQDGTYSHTPIRTYLNGNIQGLGNTISHIKIVSHHHQHVDGLLLAVLSGGSVQNLGIANLVIRASFSKPAVSINVGGLTEGNVGLLFGDHVGGTIKVYAKKSGGGDAVAGLASYNGGVIENCYSTADVYVDGGDPGGLVAANEYEITGSFATGSVTVKYEGQPVYAGGLIAGNAYDVTNSYATGNVTGYNKLAILGGFAGSNSSRGTQLITTSYSTGAVSGGGTLMGGFVGDDTSGSCSDCYWDTQTSGQSNGTGQGNVSGITGLTTKQLRHGLPQGFDPAIWSRKKGVNNGFPYLIANPPPG